MTKNRAVCNWEKQCAVCVMKKIKKKLFFWMFSSWKVHAKFPRIRTEFSRTALACNVKRYHNMHMWAQLFLVLSSVLGIACSFESGSGCTGNECGAISETVITTGMFFSFGPTTQMC